MPSRKKEKKQRKLERLEKKLVVSWDAQERRDFLTGKFWLIVGFGPFANWWIGFCCLGFKKRKPKKSNKETGKGQKTREPNQQKVNAESSSSLKRRESQPASSSKSRVFKGTTRFRKKKFPSRGGGPGSYRKGRRPVSSRKPRQNQNST